MITNGKSELYIYFYSFILSVLILFIIILWVFTCDFYLVSDIWVKGSKRKRKRTKEAENKESWDSCHDMVLACCSIFLYHTNSWEQYPTAWCFCAAACYVSLIVDFCSMLQHVKIMPWHGGPNVKRDFYYFWKLGLCLIGLLL